MSGRRNLEPGGPRHSRGCLLVSYRPLAPSKRQNPGGDSCDGSECAWRPLGSLFVSTFDGPTIAGLISGGPKSEVSDGVCKIRDACSNREVIETLWQALLSRTASATAQEALQASSTLHSLAPLLAAR